MNSVGLMLEVCEDCHGQQFLVVNICEIACVDFEIKLLDKIFLRQSRVLARCEFSKHLIVEHMSYNGGSLSPHGVVSPVLQRGCCPVGRRPTPAPKLWSAR